MSYDILVLGSGPGGYVAAIRGAQLGLKVAIVEKAELGGVCLNWGCIPTKALLKSAQVYEYLLHAQDYGVTATGVSADFTAIVKRSRNVADAMSKGVQFLMKKNKIEVIAGTGILKPGRKLEVTGSDGKKNILEAKNIIVATGARSRELPGLKQDGKKVIGYREAMTLDKKPDSLVVVGSGAIGVEFAYFYHSLGTKVTVVEFMPEIVPLEDEDVSKQLARSFKKSGISIMTESTVESVDTSGKGCKVNIKSKKGNEIIECDIVLSAVGITANIENIGLQDVGIITDKGKIVTNEWYQSNIPGYFAIGDVLNTPALAHVASHEAITCVEKIAGLHAEPIDYKNVPGCTYCQPEIASVGYTEKAAKAAGYEVKVGKFPFSASGKAKAGGNADGFIKVIFDAKYGEWLGAHMIGANVTELIAEVVTARKLETTGHEIIKSIHPHPTMSEAIMEAVAEAYGECIHL
jgi:dihydrolipoamide dehydrogenase